MKTHCDVLVIGGGIIGLACAHYLADSGRKVRLIEKDRIGAGASHGNCGLIFTSDLVPLCKPGAVRSEIGSILRAKSRLYIGLRPDLARMRWLLNFAAKCTRAHMEFAIEARRQLLSHSAELFADLFAAGDLHADRECRGVLMVYATEDGWHSYAATNELLRPHGYHAEPLRGNELKSIEPALKPELYGAWYHPKDFHLRPDRLLDSWRQLLDRKGVVIEEGLALRRLIHQRGEITAAQAGSDEIVADNYVLAAGAWSKSLLQPLNITMPIEPGKGYSITMARPAGAPQVPCYLHEKYTVATPWQSGYRLGGVMEFSGHNSILRSRHIRNLKSSAQQYLNSPLGDPVHEEWTGMRPMTYDELPVIDRAPRLDNLFLATGHGMLGLSTAPATGKLVAEMVAGGRHHIDPAPFRADRF